MADWKGFIKLFRSILCRLFSFGPNPPVLGLLAVVEYFSGELAFGLKVESKPESILLACCFKTLFSWPAGPLELIYLLEIYRLDCLASMSVSFLT